MNGGMEGGEILIDDDPFWKGKLEAGSRNIGIGKEEIFKEGYLLLMKMEDDEDFD